MKQKKVLLILTIVFVVLLAGAGVLYKKLGSVYTPEQMVEEEQPAEAVEEAKAEETKEEEAQAEESQTGETEEKKGVPARDFIAYDAEGNAVALLDFVGKPVVLNFWASWCGNCKMQMPYFQEQYEEMGDEVQFLMVNMTDGSRETLEIAKTFVDESGYTFPVLYDTDIHAAAAYAVYSIPCTYFINAEGRIIARTRGAISGELLKEGIAMIK